MNKLTIKKMLAKQIKVIIQVETDMAISRWKRAKALSEMHNMIVWSKSPYKSFKRFVQQEFPNIDPTSASIWAINYNQMHKWYTWSQIQQIAKAVSYSKAVRTQQSLSGKSKLPLSKFIATAKKFVYSWRGTPKTTVANPNRITLIMPILYVEKLENILINHGYIPPKTKEAAKIGISDAMVKYLDTV